jgi:TIR domain
VSTRYGSPATGTRDRFARPMIVRQRWGTGRAIDTPPTAAIFMSFAGSDAAAAETVTTALKAAGHRVWRFTEGVRGGSDWYEEMLGQVVRCDVVVFLASRASAGSEFCQIELECARDHNRRIVVVRLDDLAGADLPAPARTGAKAAAEWMVRSRRLRERFSLEDLRIMIDLYGSGATAREVAEKYGVSLRSIKRLLRQHGVRRER